MLISLQTKTIKIFIVKKIVRKISEKCKKAYVENINSPLPEQIKPKG